MLDGRSYRHAPGSSVAEAPRLLLSGWHLVVCRHRLAVHCYSMAPIVLSSFFSCSYPISWVSWALRQCGMLFAHRRMISYFCCVRRNAFWLHLYLFFQAINTCAPPNLTTTALAISFWSFISPRYCCAWCSSSCNTGMSHRRALGRVSWRMRRGECRNGVVFIFVGSPVLSKPHLARFHTCKCDSTRALSPACCTYLVSYCAVFTRLPETTFSANER